MRRPLFIAGVLCSVLTAAACLGGDLDEVAGKWRHEWRTSVNEVRSETIELRKDGTVSLAMENGSCTGTVQPDEGRYRITMDCGVSKADVDAVLSEDGKKLTLTKTDGEKAEFIRVSD